MISLANVDDIYWRHIVLFTFSQCITLQLRLFHIPKLNPAKSLSGTYQISWNAITLWILYVPLILKLGLMFLPFSGPGTAFIFWCNLNWYWCYELTNCLRCMFVVSISHCHTHPATPAKDCRFVRLVWRCRGKASSLPTLSHVSIPLLFLKMKCPLTISVVILT
jgi:hypothetical protein